MVVGALLPLLVFSTALTAYSWWQERTALEFRQLERVRAITIALETELQASIRVLRSVGLLASLDPSDPSRSAASLRHIAAAQPLWTTLAMGDAQWRRVTAVTGAGEDAPMPPAIHEATRRQAVDTGLPAVSPLVQSEGRYKTQIVVPVVGEGAGVTLLMAAIDQAAWLEFIGRYPIATGATLTLLDQDGLVIARTLNNDRWVGKPPSPDLLRNVRERAEGAFRSTGLEGQQFYSAHSRSTQTGWAVATGLPAQAVELSLRDSSALLLGAAVISILVAILLALLFGRRIERPVSGLGEAARALERGQRAPLPVPLHDGIDEVDEVGHAFHSAARELSERERALNDALVREQQLRRDAEQASAAKDDYLAMLGHELRNPLNALSSATAIASHDPRSDQAARAREIVARQVVHLRRLVDDLLDVARVTRGMIELDCKPVDLARIVRRTVAAMSGAGRLGKHLVEVDAGEAWVHGDETRLEQVVANLLDNAGKYTHDGGRVTIRTRTDGDEAVLQIEDNGMGIAPELLPRVFDLFSQGERTLDRTQGGLGLGLALVRRLAELHGGRVDAVSKGPGKGASFTVRLPGTLRPADAGVPTAPPQDEGKALRILLVEDNPDGRETLRMMLNLKGHEVHEADTGPRGFEQAVALQPDVAIVDIGLPGYDGYEVARRVRAEPRAAGIRLVALTGYGQEDDRKNALKAGFDWFLVKPADIDALNDILASV